MKALNVSLIDRETANICLNCLTEVLEEDNFCGECGVSIDEADTLGNLEDVIKHLVKLKFVKKNET